MNSCILMAEIVQEPQLRYTADNQTQITEMLVEFPGPKQDDPPETLKVVVWGNLAQETYDRYRPGDRVVIEGRLSMNTVDRPEGFKEKRAELTAQRIHSLELNAGRAQATRTPSPSNVVSFTSRNQAGTARRSETPPESDSGESKYQSPPATSQTYSAYEDSPDDPSTPGSERLGDDIPF
jgi:single-stranded DNA-binding protein